MLEKKQKKIYFDAHFHLSDMISLENKDFFQDWSGCTCILNQNQLEKTLDIIHLYSQTNNYDLTESLFFSYGIHPQNLNQIDYKKELEFLIKLLETNTSENQKIKISAIGECGFDFFSKEDRIYENLQKMVFSYQMELAVKYKMPLVIHCRKGNSFLYEYTNQLKQIPVVLFHSFMGNSTEAFSFLKKDINAYFSFGKQCMNNNKKVIDCIENIPSDNLLLETDGPFQSLKNEKYTKISDIKMIYEQAFSIKKQQNPQLEYDQFLQTIKNNFYKVYLNIS